MPGKMPIRIEWIAAVTLLSCFIGGGLCVLTGPSAADNDEAVTTDAMTTFVNRVNKRDGLLPASTLRPRPNTSYPSEMAKRTLLGCDPAFSSIAEPAHAHIVKRCMAELLWCLSRLRGISRSAPYPKRHIGNSARPRKKTRGIVFQHYPVASGDRIHTALTVIFFSAFCASALLGKVTMRTPFLKFASILSVSTPAGT